MPREKDRVTAHVKRISQDNPQITTLILSEKQLLELVAVATVALREKRPYGGGYHLAIWKDRTGRVAKCRSPAPCEGGDASIVLVRRSEK